MTDQEKKVKKETPKKENPIMEYLRDTRSELKKVNWPDRQETVNLTKIVLAFTFGMALFLGLLDLVFVRMLGGIVTQNLWAYIITAVVLGAIAAAAVLIKRNEGA
ncbi:MAG: preprotein translocase subunit SecE [Anaerolineae bacterium]|nr:preprotein translocase subunit SecE [Anaerolineae bacterium]